MKININVNIKSKFTLIFFIISANPTQTIAPNIAHLLGELACIPPEYFLNIAIANEIIIDSTKTLNIYPKITTHKKDHKICNITKAPYEIISSVSLSKFRLLEILLPILFESFSIKKHPLLSYSLV